MDRHNKSTTHLICLLKLISWRCTGSQCLLSLVHKCTCISALSSKRALNRSRSASVWFALEFGMKKCGRGELWVFCIVRVKCFLVLSFRNVKVAAQGHYCVSEEKTPLRWFMGRSKEIYNVLYQVHVSVCYCLVCDVTVGTFSVVWHFYTGKKNVQSGENHSFIFVYPEQISFSVNALLKYEIMNKLYIIQQFLH